MNISDLLEAASELKESSPVIKIVTIDPLTKILTSQDVLGIEFDNEENTINLLPFKNI